MLDTHLAGILSPVTAYCAAFGSGPLKLVRYSRRPSSRVSGKRQYPLEVQAPAFLLKLLEGTTREHQKISSTAD